MVSIAAGAVLGAMYLDAKYYIGKDVSSIRRFYKIVKTYRDFLPKVQKLSYASVYLLLDNAIKEHPDKEAFLFVQTASNGDISMLSFSYLQVENEVAKLADWFLSRGFKPKDIVAVFMPNSPQLYFTLWALAKIGVAAALVNASLTRESLIYCTKVSTSTHIVTVPFSEQMDALGEIDNAIKDVGAQVTVFGMDAAEMEKVDRYEKVAINTLPRTGASDGFKDKFEVRLQDPAFFVYTSGTTGMPKAAVLIHSILYRPSFTTQAFGWPLPKDRFYTSLPLYHTSALTLGLLGVTTVGATYILAPKFSSRHTISEVRATKATILQHIGEVCRYLLNTPPTPYDRDHSLRLIVGNGLRAEIWEKFRDRFGVSEIYEFYGSTDGNTFLSNVNRGPDGVGFFSHRGWILRFLDKNVKIVKHDPITEQPSRDPRTGFCIEAAKNETGEILGRIDPNMPTFRPYFGDEQAVQKKILRNVAVKGDMWYRNGDLVRINTDGWLEFVDRIGDTFRWKGENVSTLEVSSAISALPFVIDCVVYGIQVPHYDGQAGMAAIVLDPSIDENDFVKELPAHMRKFGVAPYAIPRFLRILSEISRTATHKLQKMQLKQEGIQKVGEDSVYVLTGKEYVKMEEKHFRMIEHGKAKL